MLSCISSSPPDIASLPNNNSDSIVSRTIQSQIRKFEPLVLLAFVFGQRMVETSTATKMTKRGITRMGQREEEEPRL